jgi:hypothetical protein
VPVGSELAAYYEMSLGDFDRFMALVRAMSAAEKIATVFRMNETFRLLVENSVRREFPDASERELFLRTTARHLDRETMIRVYGWDPTGP